MLPGGPLRRLALPTLAPLTTFLLRHFTISQFGACPVPALATPGAADQASLPLAAPLPFSFLPRIAISRHLQSFQSISASAGKLPCKKRSTLHWKMRSPEIGRTFGRQDRVQCLGSPFSVKSATAERTSRRKQLELLYAIACVFLWLPGVSCRHTGSSSTSDPFPATSEEHLFVRHTSGRNFFLQLLSWSHHRKVHNEWVQVFRCDPKWGGRGGGPSFAFSSSILPVP